MGYYRIKSGGRWADIAVPVSHASRCVELAMPMVGMRLGRRDSVTYCSANEHDELDPGCTYTDHSLSVVHCEDPSAYGIGVVGLFSCRAGAGDLYISNPLPGTKLHAPSSATVRSGDAYSPSGNAVPLEKNLSVATGQAPVKHTVALELEIFAGRWLGGYVVY